MEIKDIYTTTDLLIVGGGLAGLTAANKIKENYPELTILIADRATSGTSGKANKGAGILMYVPEDVDMEEYKEYVAGTLGAYLNDQELMPKYCAATREALIDLEKWGCSYARDPDWDNELVTFSIDEGERWKICMIDHDCTEQLRKSAVLQGVKFIDKLQIVDYLTKDGAVIGAVGFDIISGDYHVISAKSVICSTGSCDYMYANMWKAARGDGIAAAYRAGAELRNCEFSNFYNMAVQGDYFCICGPGCLFAYTDNEGRPIPLKYATRDEPDISVQFLYGIENEVANGRGPILFRPENFLELPGNSMRPWQWKFEEHSHGKEVQYNADKSTHPTAIPYFLGEFSATRVDHDMHTTLSGLWAIGDSSYTGSGLCGALPGPSARMRGSGLMFAAASAEMCSKSVGAITACTPLIEPDEAQITALKDRIFAPLNRKDGVNPRDIIYELQCAVAPPYFSVSKTAEKIDEALGIVREAEFNANNLATADGDLHMLGLCHDAMNMSKLGELYFVAARARTESRGFHYRQDYPHMDNVSWVKWSVIKNINGADVLGFEDIPTDDYTVQPMFYI